MPLLIFRNLFPDRPGQQAHTDDDQGRSKNQYKPHTLIFNFPPRSCTNPDHRKAAPVLSAL
jgi:hypothetical protein